MIAGTLRSTDPNVSEHPGKTVGGHFAVRRHGLNRQAFLDGSPGEVTASAFNIPGLRDIFCPQGKFAKFGEPFGNFEWFVRASMKLHFAVKVQNSEVRHEAA